MRYKKRTKRQGGSEKHRHERGAAPIVPNLVDAYPDKIKQAEQAVASEDPVEASAILQELTECIHDEHPDAEGEAPNYHRDDLNFSDKDRADEFVGATAHALQQYEETGDSHWLTVASCEIDGFRQVVLSQTSNELGWEPVNEDDEP